MTTHELKTWPFFFELRLKGLLSFELRKADRPFQVGDSLKLLEWDPEKGKYTGRWIVIEILFIMKGPILGLEKGWLLMSVSSVEVTKLR